FQSDDGIQHRYVTGFQTCALTISTKYEYNRSDRFNCGTVDITLSIEQNRIAKCRIYGDFFGQGDITEVEEALIGTKVVKAELIKALDEINLKYYFGNITSAELTQLILS